MKSDKIVMNLRYLVNELKNVDINREMEYVKEILNEIIEELTFIQQYFPKYVFSIKILIFQALEDFSGPLYYVSYILEYLSSLLHALGKEKEGVMVE